MATKCPKCGSTDLDTTRLFTSNPSSHKTHGAVGGAAAGFALGGPIGAAIGAGIGALFGSSVDGPEYRCLKCGHTWYRDE